MDCGGIEGLASVSFSQNWGLSGARSNDDEAR
jgi:hypothetical protein